MITEYKLESFYRDLVEEYLANKKNEFSNLEKALETNDFSAIKVIGHNLAGTGGSYGLSALTELGDILEAAAEKEDGEKCREMISQYKLFLDSVKVEYNE